MSEKINDWLKLSYGSYVPPVIENLYGGLDAQLQEHIGEYVLVLETQESQEFHHVPVLFSVPSLCPPHWRRNTTEYLSLGVIKPGGLILSKEIFFEIPTGRFVKMEGQQIRVHDQNMEIWTVKFDAKSLQRDEAFQKAIASSRVVETDIETTFEVVVGDQAVSEWFKEKNRNYRWLDLYQMAAALGRVVWTPEMRAAVTQQRKRQPRYGSYAYVICPADHYKPMEIDKIQKYVEELERTGTMAYWPYRDCAEDDPTGQTRLSQKRAAIREADEVHFWWNDYAKDTMFELGIAYELDKKIVIMNPGAIPRTPGSSINNFCLMLAGE